MAMFLGKDKIGLLKWFLLKDFEDTRIKVCWWNAEDKELVVSYGMLFRLAVTYIELMGTNRDEVFLIRINSILGVALQ